MKELIVLAADRDIEQTMIGLLNRPADLGIRPVSWDIYVHPRRDPGCLNEAQDFLRPWSRECQHALLMFDHQGCGHEDRPASAVAGDVRSRLARNGWQDRAEVVVLSPELEVWVWSEQPCVDVCLGWAGLDPPLREWLAQNRHWPLGAPKPPDPKGAMEAALRQVRKPRSSAIYLNLARTATLQGHSEPAFAHLVQTLQRWFPQ